MKIALLQLNFIVGDLEGNSKKIVEAVQSQKEVDLFITSELAIVGYMPRDFLLNKSFIRKSCNHLGALAKELSPFAPVLVGGADMNSSGKGRPLYNSAFLLQGGEVTKTFHKTLLPSHDVFDEERYFEASPEGMSKVMELNGFRIGITICEDIWNNKSMGEPLRYKSDPIDHLVFQKVDCIVNLSASPFTIGKQAQREKMLGEIAATYGLPIVYVNQVGGNDDLVFDGRSCAFNCKGTLVARGKGFAEDIVTTTIGGETGRIEKDDFSEESEVWNALVCGIRDYVTKCGFKKALLGLSGGIDSALTAVVAVEAIGKENVQGLLMPSPYSSQGSIYDSLSLAKNLGIKTSTVPIINIMKQFDHALQPLFQGHDADVTEENIQARIRGNLLMAASNKFRAILLSTGNKSEMSVGYCTIYGDMSGGMSVLSDIPKTLVFKICRWLNTKGRTIIPSEIIDKPPSAELREDQFDQDSLPAYDVLDEILYLYVELHFSNEEIVAKGFDKETVTKVLRLVKNAEFKRKQAPPGIKVTPRAFGTGWRVPIACKRDF